MCPTVQRIFLIVSLLGANSSLLAQPIDPVPSTNIGISLAPATQIASLESGSPQEVIDIPIDEILVIGEKSTVGMRLEIRRLNKEIVDELNALIENQLYKVNCSLRRYRSSQVRTYVCQPGFVMIARNYAYEEAAALAALNELSEDLFIEPDALIPNDEVVNLTGFAGSSLTEFDSTEGLLLTELQRHQEEFEQIVFNLAKDDNQLAEKLVRKYYLELSLEHRKKNWWKYFFRREVEEIEIPTSLVRLVR